MNPTSMTITIEQMETRIREIKKKFGDRLYIPGHHYQKDEVIQFADDVGDSLQLAKFAAKNEAAEFIVFCGVHFMAETADILTRPDQKVILPNPEAGCSMADMANLQQTEKAWNQLTQVFGETILPLTYVNSTAAIKAFVGRHEGSALTSSNAKKVLAWAFRQKERVLFLPDQYLGRNTAYNLGIKLDEMAVWDPTFERLEYNGDIGKIKIILWKGHCGVHQNFTVEHISQVQKDPEMKVIVHPECSFEVVQSADESGSTQYIINAIENSPRGSKWAVGTEANLVNRLKNQYPDKEINSLNPFTCLCSTMNRITLPDLYHALEKLEQGEVINQITVDQKTANDALKALNQMLLL